MQSWKASKAYFWEEAPFFRLLLPLAVAVICYEYKWLPAIEEKQLLLLSGMLLLLTVVAFFIRKSGNALTALRLLTVHATIFLLGWLVCFKTDVRHNDKWFGKQLARADAFEAQVLQTPAEKAKTWKVKVAVTNAYTDGKVKPVTGDAFVYMYKDDSPLKYKLGDVLLLPNKWQKIKNAGNPYEFDYARFCRRNGIHYLQFIPKDDVTLYQKGSKDASFINATHEWSMQALNRYVKDSITLGLMQAMLLGDEVNFDPELRQSYAETGIIHIVAISGSHVMIFFQFISLLLFWIRNKKYAPLKYLIAVPLVCFYVAVAGAPTSAVRAAIMFSILALGTIIQKDRQPLNQLFFTAFIMLLYEPMWLFAIGFQLSFIAVLSLILFYRPIYKLYIPGNIVVRNLWQAVAASIAAEILIAPIIIFYFHLLPSSFLIANLFAYVFMSVVLILGLLLVVLSKITIVAKAITSVITAIVLWFNDVVISLQSMNPDVLRHLHLSLSEVVFVYLTIIGFAVYLLKRKTAGPIIGLSAVCCLLISLSIKKWDTLHQRQFVLYNINKKSYAELIKGDRYNPIIADTTVDADKDYATKELHIVSGAWEADKIVNTDVVSIGNKNILILREPLAVDTAKSLKVDYLLVSYPIKDFTALQLQKTFGFKKLIIASNQKRYLAERWRDSCRKYSIPAHFTMFDGAFVLK